MNFFLIISIVLFLYMNIWFIVSLIKKRNDIADIAWGIGFVLLAWTSFCISDTFDIRSLVVSILVSIWGLRLARHIYRRNKNKDEDYRYLAWRKEWRKWFYLRSYFQIYILQGLFLFLIILPVLIINKNSNSNLNFLDIIGVIIWCVGFLFEAIGDRQLAKFTKDPQNKRQIIQSGLWKYTRHPNYFGEVTQWWGLWIIAITLPGGWLTTIGPLTITILILKVSGIPLLEKKMSQNLAFVEYKKRTNMFIPWFRKKI